MPCGNKGCTFGGQAFFIIMNITNRMNGRAVAEAETITVTISRKFLKNLQKIAYLFRDEDKDLGLILEISRGVGL
jgi:hypothetical protein